MAHLKKAWINQPSTLQSRHSYHGMNVIVDIDDENDEGLLVIRLPKTPDEEMVHWRIPRECMQIGCWHGTRQLELLGNL